MGTVWVGLLNTAPMITNTVPVQVQVHTATIEMQLLHKTMGCYMLNAGGGTGSTRVGCSQGSGLNQRFSGVIGVRTVASAHVLHLPTNSV